MRARLPIILLPIILLAWADAGPAAAQPVLRWSPADTTIAPGNQATLAIMLDDALAVRTIELYVSYDSAVVSSLSGSPGDLFSGFNLFSGFEEVDAGNPGQWHAYCVILGAGDWAEGPGELYRWTCSGDVLGTSPQVTVSVKLLPPGGGDYTGVSLPSTTVVVGDISGVPPVAAAAPSLDLYPNPFNPRVNLVLPIEDDDLHQLDIFDARGRRVVRAWQGRPSPSVVLAWDGRDRYGRDLPSGVYTFVLTGAGGVRASARGTLLR